MTRGQGELAAFLRQRRESIDPASFGIPEGSRRRTPGLRREEVARLANVGVTWYTWLEQGRNIHPSRQVTESIAKALHLSQLEHDHVMRLAGYPVESNSKDSKTSDLRALQLVLDQLAPYPASVLDLSWQLVAFNRSYRFLNEDLASLPDPERNCLRMMFLNESWAAMYSDIGLARRRAVMRARSTLGAHLEDERIKRLIDDLLDESPEFRALWQRGEVGVEPYPIKMLESPRVGTLRLRFTTMHLSDGSRYRMVVMPPDDEATEQKLRELDRFALTAIGQEHGSAA